MGEGDKDAGLCSQHHEDKSSEEGDQSQGPSSSGKSKDGEKVASSSEGKALDKTHQHASSSMDKEEQPFVEGQEGQVAGTGTTVENKNKEVCRIETVAANSAKLTSFADKLDIPESIFEHILSCLTWKQLLGVRRVSRSWSDAVNACLLKRTELRIHKFDFPVTLDDEALEKLLKAMPNLKCLHIEWRLDGRKLNVDVVSQHSSHLVKLDLSRFRVDTWSLEQLCIACPKLEEVKLPRKCDDASVEVLLINLPYLRSLDIANTKVTCRFLRLLHRSLKKISLASCTNLAIKDLHLVLNESQLLHTPYYWGEVRDLDLSSTTLEPDELPMLLRLFPGLERLSLAHCGEFAGSSLAKAVAFSGSLRDVDLSHVPSLKMSDLLTILTISKLERLSLAGCTIVESTCSMLPSLSLVDLRELDISGVRGLTSANLISILCFSPRLEHLLAAEVDMINLTACLTHWARYTELRELDVSCSGAPQSPPESNSEKKRAASSVKDGCAVTTSRKNEQQGPETQEGGQSGEKSSAVGCSGGRGRHPISVGSSQHEMPDQKSARPSAETIGRLVDPVSLICILSGCTKLKRLVLAGCHLSEPTSICRLALCSYLRQLDISWVTSVEPLDLACGLSGCRNLESLSVAGLKAPLEQFVPQTGLRSLRHLDASRSGLTNNSLRRLPGLFPHLQTLVLQGCTGITEDGLLSYLPRLQKLRSLDLRNVPCVTEVVLSKLKRVGLTKLRLGPVGEGEKHPPQRAIRKLVLGCPSLKLLWLEAPDYVLQWMTYMMRHQLPGDRILVICDARNAAEDIDFKPESDRGMGHVHLINGKSIDWDKE